MSVDSGGAEAAGGHSSSPSISAKGRFIALTSGATNLVAGDTNGQDDVFLCDRKTGDVTRVSVDSSGAEATGGASDHPAISANGRFVAFVSAATNLVAGDSNSERDVFVHDRKTGTTTRVSVDSSGAQADNESLAPAISRTGRFVAFYSSATNLVTGDTNGGYDVFVHDRKTATTSRVSVTSAGVESIVGGSFDPAISASGRFVAFESDAINLVAGDTNSESDVFVHDRKTGTTTRVSVNVAGDQATGGGSSDPAISAKGRIVAFESSATNLVIGDTNAARDIFVHDRKQATTSRVSVDSIGAQATGGDSVLPALSAKGRIVAFQSEATDLVTGDSNASTDVFVHDRKTGTTTRVSVTSAGAEAAGANSGNAAISAKGRFVAFDSFAANLVPGDTNLFGDVFLHDRK